MLAVLAAHAALLAALWAWRAAPWPAPAQALSTLRWVAPPPPRPAGPTAKPAKTPTPAARSPEPAPAAPTRDGAAPSDTNAISLPAAVPVAPSASAPLNLALPPSFRGEGPMVPARQAQGDPRANSPRPSFGEQLFGADGGAELRIETQSGAQIRGPQGRCTQVTNNTWAQMNPMDPNARALPSKVHDCSKLAPGAARHARPK